MFLSNTALEICIQLCLSTILVLCLTANSIAMKFSTFIIIVLVLSFSTSFSQELQKNETLVKQLEGVSFSYSKLNDNSDYIFKINNTSGNAVKLEWDVKLFYSETNSIELHKVQITEPGDASKVSAVGKTLGKSNNQSQYSSRKGIKRIEIHNVKFTGLQ